MSLDPKVESGAPNIATEINYSAENNQKNVS